MSSPATQAYSLKLNTDSASEPVTTAEAKTHLRVEHTNDDAYIASLVKAARTLAERWTQRSFVNTTWDLYFDCFPSVIYVPRSPLVSVSSITYTDQDGNSDTVSSNVYTVNTQRDPGEIYEAYNQNWPTDYRAVPDVVKVTYVAGYGASSSSVPEPIRMAVRLIAGHWYENREEVTAGAMVKMPTAAEALLAAYQVGVYR